MSVLIVIVCVILILLAGLILIKHFKGNNCKDCNGCPFAQNCDKKPPKRFSKR